MSELLSRPQVYNQDIVGSFEQDEFAEKPPVMLDISRIPESETESEVPMLYIKASVETEGGVQEIETEMTEESFTTIGNIGHGPKPLEFPSTEKLTADHLNALRVIEQSHKQDYRQLAMMYAMGVFNRQLGDIDPQTKSLVIEQVVEAAMEASASRMMASEWQTADVM